MACVTIKKIITQDQQSSTINLYCNFPNITTAFTSGGKITNGPLDCGKVLLSL